MAAAAHAVMDDLGYEDMDSFEASLGEPFESWVKVLRLIECAFGIQLITCIYKFYRDLVVLSLKLMKMVCLFLDQK